MNAHTLVSLVGPDNAKAVSEQGEGTKIPLLAEVDRVIRNHAIIHSMLHLGLSCEETAGRFGIHVNTVHNVRKQYFQLKMYNW